jgi:transcriptional regulator of NAD metabolism
MARRSLSERRVELLRMLRTAAGPVSGSELSTALRVSRQAIAHDIAILRATGETIVGSRQGYHLAGSSRELIAVIRCHHEPLRFREELEVLVDRGVSVLDVGVDHSVFGEIRARVVVDSRADIERQAETFAKTGDAPLSELTRGFHSHTVRAPNHDALQAAKRELLERGILREE